MIIRQLHCREEGGGAEVLEDERGKRDLFFEKIFKGNGKLKFEVNALYIWREGRWRGGKVYMEGRKVEGWEGIYEGQEG